MVRIQHSFCLSSLFVIACGGASNSPPPNDDADSASSDAGSTISDSSADTATTAGDSGVRSEVTTDSDLSYTDSGVAESGTTVDSGATLTDSATTPTDVGSDAVLDAGPVGKIVFATSLRYPADLKTAGGGSSGVDGGDKICNTLAAVAGLTGTFKAWLSTDTDAAIDRITTDGPWKRVDGVVVFKNRANLMTVPLAPIDLDEDGHAVDTYYDVATGTALGGRPAGESGCTTTTCNGWTTTSSDPGVCIRSGIASKSDSGWTDNNVWTTGECDVMGPIYCFED